MDFHGSCSKGNLFKNRPVVALSEGTIDGAPQNHAPPAEVYLPASFGIQNVTIRPPSQPVTFLWSTLETPGNRRIELLNVDRGKNWRDWEWVSQFILPDLTVAGWATTFGDHDCPTKPEGVSCDIMTWEIEDEMKVFKPRGEGRWDAVKTKEGCGWRLVWKKNIATVQHEVQILAVQVKKQADNRG